MQSRCTAAGIAVTFEPGHHPEYEPIHDPLVDQHESGGEVAHEPVGHIYGLDVDGGLFDYPSPL